MQKESKSKVKITKLQTILLCWIILFAIISIISSLLRIYKMRDFIYASIPSFKFFIAYLIIVSLWRLYYIMFYYQNGKDVSAKYIKENYSEIWARFFPAWTYGFNELELYRFSKGKYDTGEDEVLNEIKIETKRNIKLVMIPFYILIFNFILNYILYIISYIK